MLKLQERLHQKPSDKLKNQAPRSRSGSGRERQGAGRGHVEPVVVCRRRSAGQWK
jgi:hypothetical protein